MQDRGTGATASSALSDMKYCVLGTRPDNNDRHFEEMTRAVFRAGFNWKVIEKKWPDFRRAFADFSIAKVAVFDEPDFDRLMSDKGIVRNGRKIRAAIENARTLLTIQKEHGSFGVFLKEISANGEGELVKTLSKRFSHLGSSTSFFFMRAVGEEMPETMERWREEHDM